MGWVLAALIALVIILLIKIIRDLKRLYDAGAHDGPPAATNDGIAAMQGIMAKLEQLKQEDRKPTDDECEKLQEMYEEAQAGNVSALSLSPLRALIDKMCD